MVLQSTNPDMFYFNSGLERKDREKMFRDSGNKWDSASFKAYILAHYDTVHELDCHVIAKSWKNKNQNYAAPRTPSAPIWTLTQSHAHLYTASRSAWRCATGEATRAMMPMVHAV